ncbi:ferric reductase-like transmembrane domain-containing protein [Janibacter sp. GXQ6167]|uniref:ferric reductase-like transmembrane domain-containing protein n=1 Tax=Janibacter sp. GXQ6167 TaxID=3240791 RepID=UPI0035257102
MNEILWYVSRATGTVSMVLLTVVLVLGMVMSGRRRPAALSSAVITGLHRSLALGLVAFLGAHVATAIAETYVDIDWIAAIVPFTSGYEPLFVGLGTIAVDLIVALVVTSLLRHRLPERAWRTVHLAAYALWPIALAHGWFLGTADQPLLRGVTVLCGAAGVAAIVWRLSATPAQTRLPRQIAREEWT